jgi:hypothetical protein
MSKTTISFSILFVCAGLFGWGFYTFEKFNFTPGPQIEGPSRFPASAEASLLHAKVPTLFVFIHPKCACTTATLAELGKLKAKAGDKLVTEVFIAVEEDESETEIIAAEDRVRANGQTSIERDFKGAIAKKFGAETSGQTYLYSPAGELLFQGGITESRGHEGDNLGSSEILNLVTQKNQQEKLFGFVPTFGCKL